MSPWAHEILAGVIATAICGVTIATWKAAGRALLGQLRTVVQEEVRPLGLEVSSLKARVSVLERPSLGRQKGILP